MATNDKKGAEPSKTKLVIPVRFSFVHVFEPSAMQEGKEKKYSASLLIDKKDTATIALINGAVDAAIEQGKASWGGKIPAILKKPLRDGDIDRPGDEAYKGMMFMSASSKTRPGIVNESVQPIIDSTEFYSGCYGRASVNIYPFNSNGNKGVACGLNHVQKLKDGEALAGRTSAEEDFGADDLL